MDIFFIILNNLLFLPFISLTEQRVFSITTVLHICSLEGAKTLKLLNVYNYYTYTYS